MDTHFAVASIVMHFLNLLFVFVVVVVVFIVVGKVRYLLYL